jgi:hypothetical protein
MNLVMLNGVGANSVGAVILSRYGSASIALIGEDAFL